MFIANDYALKQEQYQDLLREAEKERLIRQVMTRGEGARVWPRIRTLFAAVIDAGKHTPLPVSVRNAH